MKQRTEEWVQKAEGDWRIAQRELESQEVSTFRSALARLSTFGVATRYPGMDADEEAAREAIETAGQVRSAVRDALDVV